MLVTCNCPIRYRGNNHNTKRAWTTPAEMGRWLELLGQIQKSEQERIWLKWLWKDENPLAIFDPEICIWMSNLPSITITTGTLTSTLASLHPTSKTPAEMPLTTGVNNPSQSITSTRGTSIKNSSKPQQKEARNENEEQNKLDCSSAEVVKGERQIVHTIKKERKT